jgi:hypothetical protein
MRVKMYLENNIIDLCKEYTVSGHIIDAIDGTWFVVDKIERKD